jgi:hypothetical protein
VFSKTVFNKARSTFQMYSVMAFFKSSIVLYCNRQVHRDFLITLYKSRKLIYMCQLFSLCPQSATRNRRIRVGFIHFPYDRSRFSYSDVFLIIIRRQKMFDTGPCCVGLRQRSFRRIRKIAKTNISFVMSVRPPCRPHGTPRLPLDGFSLNLILKPFFSKICRENWSFTEVWQE